MARKQVRIALLVLAGMVWASARAETSKPAGLSKLGELPYRPQWVSTVKKGKFFKYKRKEFSSPAIRKDLIYVGADSGYFYAMQKKNGRKRWRFRTEGSVNSAPAFAEEGGGMVLFGDDDGHLYSLSAETGSPLWKADFSGEILSAPAVHGDRVYVSASDGTVAALSLGDGRRVWEKQHPAEKFRMTILGASSPAMDGDRLFVGFADGTLQCLAASDGRLIWEKSFKDGEKGFFDIDGEPVVDGDTVYVATFAGRVLAVSKAKGDVRWSVEIGSGVRIHPRGEMLYVSGSGGRLHALDKKTGAKAWETKIGSDALTAPVSLGDILAVGLSGSTMNFVRLSDGKILARRFARRGVFSDPVIDENRIYYLSNGGRLYSLKFVN